MRQKKPNKIIYNNTSTVKFGSAAELNPKTTKTKTKKVWSSTVRIIV
jgi:hypothetical protein